MIFVRWLAITAFAGFAFKRKSVTTWILVAMAAGAESVTIGRLPPFNFGCSA